MKDIISAFLMNIISKKFMATIFGVLVIVGSRKIGVTLETTEIVAIVALIMGEQAVQGIADIINTFKKVADKTIKLPEVKP